MMQVGLRRAWATATSRRATVVWALVLVLVPTLFSVFPAWSRWGAGARVAIVAGWFLAAALVTVATARDSERVQDLVGAQLERRELQRQMAGRVLIENLLAAPPGFPGHYQFRLFLYDATLRRLMPAYEPDGVERSCGWAPGQGATGQAYRSGRPVVVRGAETHDDTYALTPEQQQRYRDLAVVAAMPVHGERGEVIGVVSGSSQHDDGFLAGPAGQDRHDVLAMTVGRVLLDIMHLSGG